MSLFGWRARAIAAVALATTAASVWLAVSHYPHRRPVIVKVPAHSTPATHRPRPAISPAPSSTTARPSVTPRQSHSPAPRPSHSPRPTTSPHPSPTPTPRPTHCVTVVVTVCT